MRSLPIQFTLVHRSYTDRIYTRQSGIFPCTSAPQGRSFLHWPWDDGTGLGITSKPLEKGG